MTNPVTTVTRIAHLPGGENIINHMYLIDHRCPLGTVDHLHGVQIAAYKYIRSYDRIGHERSKNMLEQNINKLVDDLKPASRYDRRHLFLIVEKQVYQTIKDTERQTIALEQSAIDAHRGMLIICTNHLYRTTVAGTKDRANNLSIKPVKLSYADRDNLPNTTLDNDAPYMPIEGDKADQYPNKNRSHHGIEQACFDGIACII